VEAIPPNIFCEDLALTIRSTGWTEVLVSCEDLPKTAEDEEANVEDDCPKVAVDAVPKIVEDEVVPKTEVTVLVEVADDAPKIAEGAAAEAGWLLWPNAKLNPDEGAAEVAVAPPNKLELDELWTFSPNAFGGELVPAPNAGGG